MAEWNPYASKSPGYLNTLTGIIFNYTITIPTMIVVVYETECFKIVKFDGRLLKYEFSFVIIFFYLKHFLTFLFLFFYSSLSEKKTYVLISGTEEK